MRARACLAVLTWTQGVGQSVGPARADRGLLSLPLGAGTHGAEEVRPGGHTRLLMAGQERAGSAATAQHPPVRRLADSSTYSLASARKLAVGGRLSLEPYVVRVASGGSTDRVEELLAALHAYSDDEGQPDFVGHVAGRWANSTVLTLDLSPSAAAWLRQQQGVEGVELDAILHAQVVAGSAQDVPAGYAQYRSSSSNSSGVQGSQAGEGEGGLLEGLPFLPGEGAVAQFDAPYQLDRVDQRRLPLDATFRYTGDGRGVDVYIMDSGVRTSHREFRGRVEPGANFSPDQPEYDWSDCAGHGTHVASLAVGETFGVAKGATLIPVRVYDCDNSGPLSGALRAVDWVLEKMASRGGQRVVINMSFGGPTSTLLNRAVSRLTDAGALVVVAAGNDAIDACGISPASARDALTVGATNADDTWAPYSNHGRCVDVTAPGTRIAGASHKEDAGVVLMSGSSMASPVVAGVAALYRQAQGGAGPAPVRRGILCSATGDVVREVPPLTANSMVFSPAGGWGGQQDCELYGSGAGGGGAVGGRGAASALLLTLTLACTLALLALPHQPPPAPTTYTRAA